MTDLQPQPLFDNLQWINIQTCNPHVRAYLQRIGIDDLEAEYLLAQRFLYAYRGSEDTFKSYRREIERLCQWSWLIKQKKIQVLDRHDIETYFDFVQKPPQSWIAYKHSHRFHTDVHGQRIPCADWRPFLLRQQGKLSAHHQARGLSQSAIRAIIAGASTFFTYLQQEQYCDKNPVLLIRQKNQIVQKHQQHRIMRKLNDRQWNQLIETLLQSCHEDAQYERHLFIFSAFYLMGLRISELADSQHHAPVMSDFFRDHAGLWWFRSIGKGNKMREIAVCDAMLAQLIRYRQYLGLSDLPAAHEARPIISKMRGHGGIGIRQLRNIVQSGFDMGIAALEQQGHLQDASDMRVATVHWLRHTAISKDVQLRPREHVRDDAGHQSVQVTDRYIEVDMQARHATARTKQLTTGE